MLREKTRAKGSGGDLLFKGLSREREREREREECVFQVIPSKDESCHLWASTRPRQRENQETKMG